MSTLVAARVRALAFVAILPFLPELLVVGTILVLTLSAAHGICVVSRALQAKGRKLWALP